MEEAKQKLISLIDKYRRIELFSVIMKIIPVMLFVIVAPVVIWHQLNNNELFSTIVLLMAEVLLVFRLRNYLSAFFQHLNLRNCKLYKSVLQPELVTEIFVYHDRISVDIRGAENYSVYVRDGELKDEFVDYFREYFGEERIFHKEE